MREGARDREKWDKVYGTNMSQNKPSIAIHLFKIKEILKKIYY
jgi:hypothetical protein